jgi:hypothetical protein
MFYTLNCDGFNTKYCMTLFRGLVEKFANTFYILLFSKVTIFLLRLEQI